MRIDAERIGVDAITKSQKIEAKRFKINTPPSKKIGFGLRNRARIYIYNQNNPHMCTSIFITYYSIKSAKNSIFYKKNTPTQIRNINTDTNNTIKKYKSVKKCC